jgi:hypothetical protein
MAKLRAIPGGKGQEKTCSLVYGLRLYPVGELAQVTEGEALLRDGTRTRIPLHLLEGTREQIRAQLLASIEAFFDIYGSDERVTSSSTRTDSVEEAGC